jgi:glycosyltransferase involved in cell wall biosynthesis
VTQPLFSVIIPTYGRPEFLAEAVASVLAQTVDDFECIVVDDASPEPVTVVEDPRVRLIRKDENAGEPAARNTGMDHARGRYLAFLDDDDLFTPNRLALALEALVRAPVALCWRRDITGSVSGRRLLEGDVSSVILDEMTPQIGQIAIRRELAPRFDEDFAALTDVDWVFRVSRDLPFATTPEPGLIYRTHSGPRNRNGQSVRITCSLKLLERYGDFFAARPEAAAFRWKRIGLMAQGLHDHALARSAFRRSLKLKLSPRVVVHMVRSVRFSRGSAVPIAGDLL